jgi:hypothetical protein
MRLYASTRIAHQKMRQMEVVYFLVAMIEQARSVMLSLSVQGVNVMRKKMIVV